MKPLSLTSLLIPAALFGAIGALAALLSTAIMITPFTGVLFVLVAIGLFYFGRKVVALKEHEDTNMNAQGAMYVAMFAYTSAWVSAGAIGFFAGFALASLRNFHADFIRTSLLGALLSAIGAIILLIVAIIVERWCQIDDDDDSNPPSSGLEQKAG